jgi:hypothetical protein
MPDARHPSIVLLIGRIVERPAVKVKDERHLAVLRDGTQHLGHVVRRRSWWALR